MNDSPMPRDEAATLFVRSIITRAHRVVIKGVTEELLEGPPGRSPDPASTSLHQWFQELDTESQRQVAAVVAKSVQRAVFGCLVVLDGVSGGYPLQPVPSEWTLALSIYEDEQALEVGAASAMVKVAPVSQGEGLHDLFTSLLAEVEEEQHEF
jgi:hypothetical protein